MLLQLPCRIIRISCCGVSGFRTFKMISVRVSKPFLPLRNLRASSSTSVPESPDTSSPKTTATGDEPLTSRQKLKAAIRDYGSAVLIFHIASGVTLLSMWYLIVSSGVDVSALIKTFGLEGTVGKFAGGASTFVVAYAIHKATAPLRIGLTLTASPLIVNYLRKKGFMKIKS